MFQNSPVCTNLWPLKNFFFFRNIFEFLSLKTKHLKA
jgi:hypothetical protein